MKKLLALSLLLVMVLGSFTAVAEDYTIYLITMDLMDQHWVNVDAGCQEAVKELAEKGININYLWDAPTKGKDDAAQIESINNAYANNAQAILLASNGPDTQVATIQQYQAEGVKFIYVDSPANTEALQILATDNQAAGKTAGEQMLEKLTADGVTEGKIGIVNVNAATTSTQQREAGFREAFEGTKFELLETQYGEGQVAPSQAIAENYITQGVVGIFGCNEGSTTGTGNAIKEASAAVVGVGFDQSDAILQLVNDGALLCTMAQNPYVMGYQGILSAASVLQGNEIVGDKDYDTGVTVVDKAYIEENKLL
ncbi:MAG: substrate-binding domain-containing protein [Clostridiales bacterium]|nr:substrate-binding domain-containing protein [Clostridiales bacterium]